MASPQSEGDATTDQEEVSPPAIGDSHQVENDSLPSVQEELSPPVIGVSNHRVEDCLLSADNKMEIVVSSTDDAKKKKKPSKKYRDIKRKRNQMNDEVSSVAHEEEIVGGQSKYSIKI